MGKWSFCRKCGWHASGTFEDCPSCDSKNVKVVDTDLSVDDKGATFHPSKEERD